MKNEKFLPSFKEFLDAEKEKEKEEIPDSNKKEKYTKDSGFTDSNVSDDTESKPKKYVKDPEELVDDDTEIKKDKKDDDDENSLI